MSLENSSDVDVNIDMSKFGALSAVMARNLDSVEDLPDYVTPPEGTYKLLVQKVGPEEINDKTALKVEYCIIETIALADPEGDKEHVCTPGNLFSEAFWFNDPEKVEKTLSVLKAKFGGLAEACGTTNLLGIMNKMEGMQVQAIITNRVVKDKETKKSKIYASTRDLIPATE